MRRRTSRARSYLDPITDQVRPKDERIAGKLPGVILFAAVAGIYPLASALGWLLGASWIVSLLAASALAAILAVGSLFLIRS
jgi:hypothetical protein